MKSEEVKIVLLATLACLLMVFLAARPGQAGVEGEAGSEGPAQVAGEGEGPASDAVDAGDAADAGDTGDLEKKKEEARKYFLEGVELFDKKEYEAALEKFRLSFGTVPHWSSRYNIGMCHYYLGSYDEACIELELFLAESGEEAPAEMRHEAEKFVKKARGKLATVTLSGLDESAEITVDGKPPKKSAGGEYIYLMPGTHHVTIMSGGSTILDEDMEAAGGEKKEIRVYLKESSDAQKPSKKHMEKKQAPPPGLRAAGWSLIGLSAASLIVMAVTGGLVLSKKSKIEDLENQYAISPVSEREALKEEASSQYDEGLKLANASTALLVIGLLAAGGGAALLILDHRMEKKPEAAGGVGLGFSPWGISVHGSF